MMLLVAAVALAIAGLRWLDAIDGRMAGLLATGLPLLGLAWIFALDPGDDQDGIP